MIIIQRRKRWWWWWQQQQWWWFDFKNQVQYDIKMLVCTFCSVLLCYDDDDGEWRLVHTITVQTHGVHSDAIYNNIKYI